MRNCDLPLRFPSHNALLTTRVWFVLSAKQSYLRRRKVLTHWVLIDLICAWSLVVSIAIPDLFIVLPHPPHTGAHRIDTQVTHRSFLYRQATNNEKLEKSGLKKRKQKAQHTNSKTTP